MATRFSDITEGIQNAIDTWEPRLAALTEPLIKERKNSQQRSIKQILGHLIDSSSNNKHRIIHLQYQPSPLKYPNYATHGNNDRWIQIQNFQEEEWQLMIQVWKYAHLHLCHVISQVNEAHLNKQWHYSEEKLFSLEAMIVDYLRHLNLHLGEIEELMDDE